MKKYFCVVPETAAGCCFSARRLSQATLLALMKTSSTTESITPAVEVGAEYKSISIVVFLGNRVAAAWTSKVKHR